MNAVKYFVRTTLYLFIVPAILTNFVAFICIVMIGIILGLLSNNHNIDLSVQCFTVFDKKFGCSRDFR